MSDAFTEAEWKLFRKFRNGMIEELCSRINGRSREILADDSFSHHEKYSRVYEHVHEEDNIIAICFNDWRRSTFRVFAAQLARNKLIPDELGEGLSAVTRVSIVEIRDL